MGKPAALFLLIHSMSKGEKDNLMRYAKASGKRDGAQYLKIFQAINAQSFWDEKKLKDKFKKEAFIKNFSEAKKNLANVILKTLREFSPSGEAIVSDLVREARLLVDRKVYEMATKRIRNGKTLALKEERFREWLQLAELEKIVLLQTATEEQFEVAVKAINKERMQIRQMDLNLQEYKDLYEKYYHIFKKKQIARGEIDLKLVDAFAKEPLMKSEKKALSVRAQREYLRNKLNIFLFKMDLKNYLAFTQVACAQYQQHKFLMEEYKLDYIVRMSSLAGQLLQNGQVKKGLQALEDFKKLKTTSPEEQYGINNRYFLRLIIYSAENGKYNLIKTRIAEIKKHLSKYKDRMDLSLHYQFNYWLGILYMNAGETKDALAWFKNVLNKPSFNIGQDIQAMARIVNLLAIYEMADHDLLAVYKAPTYKYLRRRNQLFKFEKRIFKFVHQSNSNAPATEQILALSRLKTDANKIFEDESEKTTLFYFDIFSWIDSRMKRLSKSRKSISQ